MRAKLTASQKKWLADRFKDQVGFDTPMAPHTAFGIGGPAEALVVPRSRGALVDLVTGAWEREIAYQVVGGGTNLLVADSGVPGLVILMTRCLDTITPGPATGESATVRVGAGVTLKGFCRYCLDHGLKGMNFAVGIPGTVGGALAMNAGTGRGSMADAATSLDLLDGKRGCRSLARGELRAAYRSLTWETAGMADSARYPAIILGGMFELARGDTTELKAEARRIMRARSGSQPLGLPSAGCVFKNPSMAHPAGKLIEMAGLKGTRRGGAVISDRHANYIVNTGGATAADVMALMALIRETVWNRFQIQLKPEVKIVGKETGSEKQGAA